MTEFDWKAAGYPDAFTAHMDQKLKAEAEGREPAFGVRNGDDPPKNGLIYVLETSLSYGGEFPEWWVDEEGDVTLRTYRPTRGYDQLTLTENDLRAMLAEVKNA